MFKTRWVLDAVALFQTWHWTHKSKELIYTIQCFDTSSSKCYFGLKIYHFTDGTTCYFGLNIHHFTNGIQLLSMFVSENHSSHSEENKFHAHKKSETVKQWNTLKPLSLSLYCEEVIHTNKMTSLFSVHRMTRHLCTWLPVKVTSRLLMFFC